MVAQQKTDWHRLLGLIFIDFFTGSAWRGKVLFDCACRAGFGRGTYLHSVGDGASRIVGQVEKRFGPHGHYLVDFYHLCEYPEGAAPACSGKSEKGSWVDRQKEFLKSGPAEKVIEALRPHLEPDTTEDRNAPVLDSSIIRALRHAAFLSARAK